MFAFLLRSSSSFSGFIFPIKRKNRFTEKTITFTSK